MNCDDDENNATHQMFADREEKKTIIRLLEQCRKNGYSINIYGDEVKTIERALMCYGRTIKKIEELEKMVDNDVEPHYWYKENYCLKEMKKTVEDVRQRDDREEER